MRIGVAPFVFAIIGFCPAIAQTPTDEQVIAAAVLPLPESYRATATVIKVQSAVKVETLRKGSNGMVCEYHSQGANVFSAACYSEPVFAIHKRQVELRREMNKGTTPEDLKAINDAIEKEVKAGKLNVPPTSVEFQLRGPMSGFDWANNKPSAEFRHWEMVIIPHATGASLGLPTDPNSPGPWVMNEGSLLAHIMIQHPQ